MTHIIFPRFPAHMDPDTVDYLRDIYEQLAFLHDEIIDLQRTIKDDSPFTVEGDDEETE